MASPYNGRDIAEQPEAKSFEPNYQTLLSEVYEDLRQLEGAILALQSSLTESPVNQPPEAMEFHSLHDTLVNFPLCAKDTIHSAVCTLSEIRKTLRL